MTSSSSYLSLYWATTVAVLSFPASVADAWILKSTGTGGWATGLAYSHDDKSYLIAGTLYTNEFWDLTLLGASTEHTQCFVVQAAHENSATALVSRRVEALQSPQVCVGGAVQVSHGNNGFAGVLGTNQNGEASLQMLTQPSVGTVIESSSALALPTQTIPVASTSMENQYVFVAMHTSINEPAFQKSNDPFNDLIGLVDYWNSLTQAPLNNDYVEIIKFDASTLEEDFLSRLELSAGSAVVSALDTYTSPTNNSDDNKMLLIAGSTNGAGDAFGIASDGAGNDEWDGYLTWIKADTGVWEHSKRLDVLPGSNDFVNDICVEGDIVYVVGFSREAVLDEFDVTLDKGFLIAIDINTHEELWKAEMGGRPVKCVAGGGSVYVGRYVSKTYIAGGAPIHTQNIIISRYDDNSADGTVIHTEKWAKEIDTTTDAPTDIRSDYLVDLVLATHEAGGLVALINSMDTTLGLNDVILLDFLRVSGRNAITDGEDDTNTNPDNEDLPDGTGRPGNDIIPPSPDRDPTRAPIAAPLDPEAIKEKDERDTVIYLAIFIPLLLGLWVIAYHVSCNKPNEKEVVQLQANTTTATTAANGANDDSSSPEETDVRQIV